MTVLQKYTSRAMLLKIEGLGVVSVTPHST